VLHSLFLPPERDGDRGVYPEVEAPEVESPGSDSSEVVDMKAVKPAKKHPRYAKV
jgi:hypothetical protein